MTERVCATGLRRYRSRGEAEQLVCDFESSGLTRQPVLRLRIRSRQTREITEAKQKLVELEIVDSATLHAEIVVVLARGRRVEVGRGFDAKRLRQVVAALEAY